MKINLLVIRSEAPEQLKEQYEFLGHQFEHHKHGNGPLHYASEDEGFVFEIYPLTKSMERADNSIRLGFEVSNLTSKIKEIEKSNWQILSNPTKTEWGVIAVLQDLEGRKVELKNK